MGVPPENDIVTDSEFESMGDKIIGLIDWYLRKNTSTLDTDYLSSIQSAPPVRNEVRGLKNVRNSLLGIGSLHG